MDQNEELEVVDVRITDVHKLPAKYFLEPEVVGMLRDVISHKVVDQGAAVPPGCEPVYGTPGQRVKGGKLKPASMQKLQLLIYAVFAILLIIYTAWSVNAYLRYPCQAFKTGYLAMGYAPGRCIR